MDGHQNGENQTELVLDVTKSEAGLQKCHEEQQNSMEVEVSGTDSDTLGRQFMKFTVAESLAVNKHVSDSNCANPADNVQNDSRQATIMEEVEPKPPEPFEIPFN